VRCLCFGKNEICAGSSSKTQVVLNPQKLTTNAWGFCDTFPSLKGAAATIFPNDPGKQKTLLDKLEAEDVTIDRLLKWTPQLEDSWVELVHPNNIAIVQTNKISLPKEPLKN